MISGHYIKGADLNRSVLVQLFLGWMILVCLVARSPAQNSNDDTNPAMLNKAAESASAKGLKYLAGQQLPNGSYQGGDVAVTSLAGLAFVAGGHLPERGDYGGHVQKTVDYLIQQSQPGGLIIGPDSDSNRIMYGHGFSTLFLAEVFGMVRAPTLKPKLQRAVALILKTQNKEGGWRYEAEQAESADISVTTCQIMALRAARNAGIAVPASAIEAAMNYVKQCQNEDGGFRYQLTGDPASGFPRSAAAIVSFYSAGMTTEEEIGSGMNYLGRFKATSRVTPASNPHFFYGHYYAVQAMWHSGGENWKTWFPAIRDQLVELQLADGCWADQAQGKVYATSMACIVLQLPNQVLPIFER